MIFEAMARILLVEGQHSLHSKTLSQKTCIHSWQGAYKLIYYSAFKQFFAVVISSMKPDITISEINQEQKNQML